MKDIAGQYGFPVLLAGGIAFHLLTLLRFPSPFVDEGWLAARAWGFLQTGKPFGILDAGILDQFDRYWYFFPAMITWIQAFGFRLFGQPSLLAIRAVSLLFGILLLIPVYSIALQTTGKTAARVAVLSLLLMGPFFSSSHLGRTDMLTALLGYSALALYLRFRRSRPWTVFLSGLLCGLAFESHAFGLIFALALLTLIFLDGGIRFLRHKEVWLAGGGLAAGLLVYLALHVFPAPSTYFALNRIIFTATHTPPLLTLDPAVLYQSVKDTLIAFLVYDPLLIPLTVVAGVQLFRKTVAEAKILPAILVCLVLGSILLMRNKLWYYIIFFSPVGIMFAAGWLVKFAQRSSGRQVDRVLRPVLASIVLAGSILYTLWTSQFLSALSANPVEEFEATQRLLSEHIGEDDVLIGPQTYWFGFTGNTYYSWQNITYYRQWKSDDSLENALEFMRPDILILDEYLRGFVSDTRSSSTYLEYLRVSKTSLLQILSERGEKLLDIDDPYAGHLEIYRIHWDDPD